MTAAKKQSQTAVASHSAAARKKPGKKLCYVLMIAKNFPSTHPKKMQETGFALKIKHYDKIHTLRENYFLWEKRFKKIAAGQAYLSIRQWRGKPYKTKQDEIFRYDNTHGIGLQKAIYFNVNWIIDNKLSEAKTQEIAKNDGFDHTSDFADWFKKSKRKHIAIIHFTDFRY